MHTNKMLPCTRLGNFSEKCNWHFVLVVLQSYVIEHVEYTQKGKLAVIPKSPLAKKVNSSLIDRLVRYMHLKFHNKVCLNGSLS